MCAANKSEIKLVIVNDKKDKQKTEIDFNCTNRNIKTVKIIRTSGGLASGESWAELPEESVENNIFNTTLKGNSITTFIFR